MMWQTVMEVEGRAKRSAGSSRAVGCPQTAAAKPKGYGLTTWPQPAGRLTENHGLSPGAAGDAVTSAKTSSSPTRLRDSDLRGIPEK